MKLKRSEKETTKLNIAIIVTVLIVIIFCLVIYLTIRDSNFRKDKVIYLKNLTSYIEDDDEFAEESYLLTSYNEYKKKIKTNELTRRNFKDNNYLFLKINYSMCDTSDDLPFTYYIQNNTLKIRVDDYETCRVCALGNRYYLIKLDKSIVNPNVMIEHKTKDSNACDGAILN